jgi:hypothetical protein
MLLLIAVLAVLSAAFIFWTATKRSRREIGTSTRRFTETTNLRPLFEPSREEMLADERLEEARKIAHREISARANERSQIDAALAKWRSLETSSAAAELLAVAVEVGDARDFARASEEILQKFKKDGFATVTAIQLADLIESHRLLLPVSERSSGTLFWLKEEIARLRSGSSGTAASKTN